MNFLHNNSTVTFHEVPTWTDVTNRSPEDFVRWAASDDGPGLHLLEVKTTFGGTFVMETHDIIRGWNDFDDDEEIVAYRDWSEFIQGCP